MKRVFEKISFEQFKKDISNNKNLYDKYILPKRATQASAGYDFFAIEEITISPGEKIKFPTGYKAKFSSDEMLMLIVRSSMGFKHNVRLTNQVGIIDSDYYNNESNEGHIWVSLQNHGNNEYIIKKGDAYMQGIFLKFLITDNDNANTSRTGGFGSTNKEREKK